ncbi:MAG: hypothetical protein KatS3mg028_0297 [Bacteroidia bacterium]|nr:MAG: hypothetical protein KatS3mg028_0297 [Bacteroidia bacterium]
MSQTQQGRTFGKTNYRLILAGVALVAVGYLLMIGGGSDDPNVFNPEIFSFRRIVLSPVVIVSGFLIITYGIMKKSDKE